MVLEVQPDSLCLWGACVRVDAGGPFHILTSARMATEGEQTDVQPQQEEPAPQQEEPAAQEEGAEEPAADENGEEAAAAEEDQPAAAEPAKKAANKTPRAKKSGDAAKTPAEKKSPTPGQRASTRERKQAEVFKPVIADKPEFVIKKVRCSRCLAGSSGWRAGLCWCQTSTSAWLCLDTPRCAWTSLARCVSLVSRHTSLLQGAGTKLGDIPNGAFRHSTLAFKQTTAQPCEIYQRGLHMNAVYSCHRVLHARS